MRQKGECGANRLPRAALSGLLACLPLAWSAPGASAQTCTTQARMSPAQRTAIGEAAYALAAAVQGGDAARVRSLTVGQYAGDAAATAYLIRTTAERTAKDTLQVTQLYLLDASTRKAGETAAADFACPLAESTSETDFGISGLPQGIFAFAMVEAQGPEPSLLAFLLQQEGGAWKMAGFYPHPRTAAGHDGLWYWTSARADAKDNRPWLAWLRYSAADQLLRPAGFVSTGNLDKLRTEQRAAAPQGLAAGISTETPLALSADGAVFQVTQLGVRPTDDTRGLLLALHIQGTPVPPGEDATARNIAAARALLNAHPELRTGGFQGVEVIADIPGGNPVILQRSMAELAAGKKS